MLPSRPIARARLAPGHASARSHIPAASTHSLCVVVAASRAPCPQKYVRLSQRALSPQLEARQNSFSFSPTGIRHISPFPSRTPPRYSYRLHVCTSTALFDGPYSCALRDASGCPIARARIQPGARMEYLSFGTELYAQAPALHLLLRYVIHMFYAVSRISQKLLSNPKPPKDPRERGRCTDAHRDCARLRRVQNGRLVSAASYEGRDQLARPLRALRYPTDTVDVLKISPGKGRGTNRHGSSIHLSSTVVT